MSKCTAMELVLESLDFPVEPGRGVGAAQRVFSKGGIAV
jgi:serine---pyruvate transaminase